MRINLVKGYIIAVLTFIISDNLCASLLSTDDRKPKRYTQYDFQAFFQESLEYYSCLPEFLLFTLE